MVMDGHPQKTPDLLSGVDLNVTTDQPQMDSGQSTVSCGGGEIAKTLTISSDVVGWAHKHRKKAGWVNCAFDTCHKKKLQKIKHR